ncbi:MAG TPA: hypothetical protein VFM25_10310 [Verrucomicrobiae bacterium]|nr:hypothetical protein [Verrucomicrobiae bacterium]
MSDKLKEEGAEHWTTAKKLRVARELSLFVNHLLESANEDNAEVEITFKTKHPDDVEDTVRLKFN